MSLSNCSRCGKMFQKISSRICMDCKEAEEQAYRDVRSFLEANPGCTIQAVSEGTGVEEAMVLRMLQDGRLATLTDLTGGMQIHCQRCGVPTTAGRYCTPCTEEVGMELKSSANSLLDQRPSSQPRLRRPETMEEKRGGH